MYVFNTVPGRTAVVNGRELLFFSGYAYLGMQHVPEFAALVQEGIKAYGWLHPSARISNTRLDIFEKCEVLLSAITGSEETVLTSSGFLAGRLGIAKWKNSITNLFPSHPAIAANAALPQPGPVFAVDSVDTLHAAITNVDFPWNDSQQQTIIIDDSHGFGLIGEKGEGIAAFLPRNLNTNYVITYSLSKAPGINAGAVSCSREVAAFLRTQPEYTACNAPSPALLYAFLHGQDLYEQQRQSLRANMQYFAQLIGDTGSIYFHPQLPVFILPPDIDPEKLDAKNIIISSFAYPDPSGPKINRVVLNALHTKSDLEYLAEVLLEIITT